MAEMIGGWRTDAVLLSCECATYSACGRDTDGEQVRDCPACPGTLAKVWLALAGSASRSPALPSGPPLCQPGVGGVGGGSGQEKGYISKKGLATGADLKCE